MPSNNIEQLKQLVTEPNWQTFPDLIAKAKQGDSDSQLAVCGALVWCAFSSPAAISFIYNNISEVYTGQASPSSHITRSFPQAALPEGFWHVFEETLNGPEGGYDAATITAAVAAMGGSVGEGFHDLVEEAARQHPGADRAETKAIPPLLTLNEIEPCPAGSLGQALYRMLVDNGYDAEVLDREAIGLAQLQPAVRYLNTRILQMHDVWHLVAGYETTSLHEISISAFQLAQFGHNYSAMFLAMVSVMSQKNSPEAYNLMMQIIAESWQHGCQTPSLMAIAFEDEWTQPIEEIRQRYRITTFQGSFPADLFEQLASSGAS